MKKYFVLLLIIVLLTNYAEAQIASSPFFDAIKSNNLEKVEKMLNKGIDVNVRDKNLATPLMWATFKGHIDLVKYLISKGANYKLKGVIFFKDNRAYYGNLMGIVAGENKKELIKYFVEELKIDINDVEYNPQTKKDDGWDAIEWAISNKNDNILKYLISKGADVNKKSISDNRSMVYFAFSNHNSSAAKLLLNNGANPNHIDAGGWSPLHLAIDEGDTSIVNLLIKLNANLNSQLSVKGFEGMTPMMLAIYHSNLTIFKIMFDAGANNKIKNKKGETVWGFKSDLGYSTLLKAYKKKGLDYAKYFIDNGAIVKTSNKELYLDLFSSLERKDFKKAKELIEKGADIHSKYRNDNDALQYALVSKNYEFAKYLIKKGAKTTTIHTELYLDLHLAAKKNDTQQLKKLIKKGVDINAKYEYNSTAMHLACKDGTSLETIKLLRENGADINSKDIFNFTVLHDASYLKDGNKIVKYLITNGANVNIKDVEGNVPLHYACEMKNGLSNIKIFIKNGAKINLQNNEGYTPLHIATEYQNYEAIKVLLKNNANMYLKNVFGETPLIMAEDEGDEKIIKLFINISE